MKAPVVRTEKEVHNIRMCRGQVLTIHLTDASNQFVDDGEMYQTIEVAVTHDGAPILYADNLEPISFDDWQPYKENDYG